VPEIDDVVSSMDGLTKATLRSGIEFKGFTKSITSVAASTEGAGKAWTTFSRLVSGTPLWAFQNKMRAYLSIIAGFETRSKANSERALKEQKILVDSVRGYRKLSDEYAKLNDIMYEVERTYISTNQAMADGLALVQDDNAKTEKSESIKNSVARTINNLNDVTKDQIKQQRLLGDLVAKGSNNKIIKRETDALARMVRKEESMRNTIGLLKQISDETLDALKNTEVYQKVLLATNDETLAIQRAKRVLDGKKEILDKEHSLRVRDAKRAYALDEERVKIAMEMAEERARDIAGLTKRQMNKSIRKGRKSAKKGMQRQMAGEMSEIASDDLSDALTGMRKDLVGTMKNILPILGPITKGFAVIKLGFKSLDIRSMTAAKFQGKIANLIKVVGPIFKMAMLYFIYAILFIVAAAVIFAYLKKFYDILEQMGLIVEIKKLGQDAFEIARTIYKAIMSFIGGDYTAMLDYIAIALDKAIAFALKASEVLLKVAWVALLAGFDLIVDFFVKLKNDEVFRKKVGDIILKIGLFLVAVLVIQMLVGMALAALSFLALPALIVVGIAAMLVVLWARFAEPITKMAIQFKNKVDSFLVYVEKGLDLWVRMFKFIYMGGAIKALAKAIKPKNPFKKAMGGTSHGGMTLVGEQGPELVNLPAGAQVKTNYQTNRMMGGTTVNNYITINARDTSKQEMKRNC
jgi:hypothetical protein